MFVGLVYLTSAWACVFSVLATHVIPTLPNVHHSPRWLLIALLSVPLSFTLAAYASLLLAWLWSGIQLWHSLVISLAHVLIAAVHFARLRSQRAKISAELVREVEHSLPLLFLLVVWGFLFLFLLHTHMLPARSDGSLWTSSAVYGDLPFHLQLIHSFTTGVNKHVRIGDLHATFFSNSNLVYPFIPDFQSAVLVASGCTLRDSLILPSLPLAVSLVGLIALLHARLTRRMGVGVLGVCLAVFCGGIAFWQLLYPRWSLYASSISKADHMQRDIHNNEIYWWSLIVHILLPQRNSLYAYPIFVSTLSILAVASDSNTQKLSVKNRMVLFALSGLLVGLTPLLQPHSMLALAIASATFCVLSIKDLLFHRELFMGWAVCAIVAALIGIPPCLLYISRTLSADKSRNASFISFDPVWQNAPSIPWFWFQNIGLFLPLSLLGTVLLPFAKNTHACKWYIGFFAVFLVCNVVRFQPWHYDNLKMFYLWVFGACGPAAWVLECIRAGWNLNEQTENTSSTNNTEPTAVQEDAAEDNKIEGDTTNDGDSKLRAAKIRKIKAKQSAAPAQTLTNSPTTPTTPTTKEPTKATPPPQTIRIFDVEVPLSISHLAANLAPELSLVRLVVTLLIALTLTFSSLLCLAKILPERYPMFSNDDIAVGKWIAENTPYNAVVLTGADHKNPALAFSGRQAVLGYEGWLWTHGIDYSNRKRQAQLIWSGSQQALQTARDLNCTIFVRSRYKNHDNFGLKRVDQQKQFLAANAKQVFVAGEWEVFEIDLADRGANSKQTAPVGK